MQNSASFDPMLGDYYLKFAAAGIASIMREWMKNDCQTSATTMAAITARRLSGIVML